MAVPVFDPDAPSEEVAAPRFDPSQAFEEVAEPRFDESKPFEEFPASISRMAEATRHTVGVVGRAVKALDFAVENQPEHLVGETPATDQWGRPLDPRGRPPEQANPAMEGARTSQITGSELLTRPLIEFPRADFRQFGPFSGNVPTGLKVAAGAYNAAVGVPEFFTSLLGVSTVAMGGFPAIVQRLVAGGFAIDLARHTPEQVIALAKAIDSGDAQAISETATGLGINVTLTGLTARHALAGQNPAVVAGRALMESVKNTEFVDPKLAALRQVAPLTAEATAKVNPEPTIEPKPGDVFLKDTKPSEAPIPSPPFRPDKQFYPNPGVVRMFHGGRDAAGDWSPYLDYAQNYVGEGGRVWFVDVPESLLRPALDTTGTGMRSDAAHQGLLSEITQNAKIYSEQSPTPLTTAAVEAVKAKEPAPETPAMTPEEIAQDARYKQQARLANELDRREQRQTEQETIKAPGTLTEAQKAANRENLKAFEQSEAGQKLNNLKFPEPPAATPERIVATAVRHPTTGQIASSPGKIHVQLYDEVGLSPARMSSKQVAESSGYMTDRGRFVLQEEGQRLAAEAQQVKPREELMGEVVKERISKESPAKPEGERALTTGADISQHLTESVPDTTAARERVTRADRTQAELRDEHKELQKHVSELEKVIKPQRGNTYTRSRIKASAKKSDVAEYNRLRKRQSEIDNAIHTLDENVKKDRALLDDAVDAGIINDPNQPLLRRIDRKIRKLEDQHVTVTGAAPALKKARDAEVRRIVLEKYPDATPEEIKRLSGRVTTQAYFGRGTWEMSNDPDLPGLRQASLEAAVNGPTTPKAHFSEELRAEISKHTASDRPWDIKRDPVEPLSHAKLTELKERIQKESDEIHARFKKEADESAAVTAAEKAQEAKLITEAQAVVDSAKRVGTVGGRTAVEVKEELGDRIMTEMEEITKADKVSLKESAETPGDYAAQGDTSVAFGTIEATGSGKFKVETRRPGGNPVKATVDSKAEAEAIIKAMAADGRGNAIIAIPGDGIFRLRRSGEHLLNIWSEVRKLSITGGEKRTPYRTEGGIEKPPGEIRTAEAWAEAKEFHGLEPSDKIAGWSVRLRDFADKVGDKIGKATEDVDVRDVEAWIKKRPEPAEGSEPQGAIGTPGPTLAPAATPAPVLPPKSQRQIITDIAQGLKLPIRFGRLRTNRFAGYFLKLQNLIGSKRANDIPIVSHEAGHKLDATFNFSGDPALRAELERLGDPAAIAGSRSSWTKSKSLKYKRGEGVAEFVRHWLTDPPAAAQHAPNMAKAFEAALDANKDFGTTMRQAQSDIQTWRNAEPQARLRSHISVGENPNKTPYTFDQLTRDLVDDLHFLRMAVNDAKTGGTSLPPSENPYLLARNLRGSYGMADSFIRSGVADFKTKQVQLGTSLQDALKPVAGRISDFRDWIVAKRAQELHSQGRETGLVDSDVQFTAAKFDGDAAFADAFTKLKKWNDDLLQYAVDSGFVTKEGAEAMRQMNQDYVPLHRVFEVGAGEAPAIEGAGTGRGLNVGKPGSLKRLTGSSRDIVDPLETMVRNAYALITASEKFAINRAVADMSKLPDMGKWVEAIATPKERVQVGVEKLREQLEANGADMTKVPDDLLLQFFQNSKSAPFGENVIKTVRDGKPEFYRLKRELFETFNALDLEDSGTLVRMLSAPSQVLRAGVVLDPSFALANVMRDAFTSSIVSRHGLLPFEATLRGVQAMLKNPKLVAEWEAAGGKNAIEANYFDRQKLQKFLSEKITKDLTPAERALIAVKSPLQALRWLTSLGEEATRIGEYQKAFTDLRKGGMPEGEARRQAAFESRDRQDFAKGGAKTKIPRRLAAFWNAGIQGNVRLAQAFREKPLATTMKGLAFITIPKLIEQSLNWNDDDYWDRPQWERDLFFLIPMGKGDDGHTQFIRIPTPFEAGVIFGTFPGRIAQSIREKSAENMKSFPMVLAKQTIPNPTPQFALTIFEDFMVGKKGYDVYRGRQIVPESIAQLPADMQWTEQTSLTARKLGAALGFSPAKIDHIINQTTGGLGKQITHQLVDRAISVATGEPRTAKGSVPGGRFVTTPAAVTSQAIEDFYSTLDKVKTAAAGEKKGRDDELARWKPMFTSAESRMSAMRRSMRQTKDEAQKNQIAENILKLARDTMSNFREQTK